MLSPWEIEDLTLWLKFSSKSSSEGIHINNITYTRPNVYGTSDACGHGMGAVIPCQVLLGDTSYQTSCWVVFLLTCSNLWLALSLLI